MQKYKISVKKKSKHFIDHKIHEIKLQIIYQIIETKIHLVVITTLHGSVS